MVAVFPATLHGDMIGVSHGGLTYGGVIATRDLRAQGTLDVFGAISAHYRGTGIGRLVYKVVPYIFHRYPAQEDLYALFRVGAKLARRRHLLGCRAGAAIRIPQGTKMVDGKGPEGGPCGRPGRRLGSVPRAGLFGVGEEFRAQPTHSLVEMRLLKSRFPAEIILHEARCGGTLVGVCLFMTSPTAVHTQYVAASDAGREMGALDLLLAELIENVYSHRRYFSFGISTENEGKVLNQGLVAHKESFGARGVVHDFYEWVLQ